MLRTLLVLCCAIPTLAHADDALCSNGIFSSQGTSFAIARATGAPRTYLRPDAPPCPNETAACLGRTYVLPGDTLLTGFTRGGYVCAFYPGRRGGSAGFVRAEEVAVQPATHPAIDAWAGSWADGDDTITLRVRGAELAAKGDAYWPSAHPTLSERPYGPNLGEMSGLAAPKGNTVVFADKDKDGCRVNLTLLPPYLLASDNMNCGGHNVSFTGIYRKR